MLIFTNRTLQQANDQSALTRQYLPLSDVLSCVDATVQSKGKSWEVTNAAANVSDANALKRLAAVFSGNRPVLLYVHGNNNSPSTCFTRCQALEAAYNVSVIGFSWESEGFQPDGSDLAGLNNAKVNTDTDDENLASVNSSNTSEGWIQRKSRRYGQAKINAQQSASALARFLRLVGSVRLAQDKNSYSAAFHSLGCHFLHYAVEIDGAVAALGAANNVALIAGCTGAAKHANWVSKIIPVRRVYIAFTNADSVLAGASIIDKDVKLGTNPGAERAVGNKYRYIDFNGAAKMKFGAHRYFVPDPGKTLSKHARLLFSRIFESELDFDPVTESQKVVYPVGCAAGGQECYMGNVSD